MQQAPVTEHAVSIKEAQPVTVLAKRCTVGMPELGATISGTFGDLYAYIGQAGIAPAGPPFVIYHARLDEGARWDIELCAPIAREAAAPAGYACRTLPAGRMASTLHRGPYEGLAAAHESITRWAAEWGHTLAGPPRETYLSEPDTPPELTETLIDWPLAETA